MEIIPITISVLPVREVDRNFLIFNGTVEIFSSKKILIKFCEILQFNPHLLLKDLTQMLWLTIA